MRTTLDLNDELLRKARRAAAKQQTTLTDVVEQALAAFLALMRTTSQPFSLDVETERGQYLGGVDPADRNTLYDVMEDRI